MRKVLKFSLCFAVSFLFLWIVCYGLWSYLPSEGEALLAMLGCTLVLAALTFSLWELRRKQKNDAKALSDRIVQLEAQDREMRAEIEALSEKIAQLKGNGENAE